MAHIIIFICCYIIKCVLISNLHTKDGVLQLLMNKINCILFQICQIVLIFHEVNLLVKRKEVSTQVAFNLDLSHFPLLSLQKIPFM